VLSYLTYTPLYLPHSQPNPAPHHQPNPAPHRQPNPAPHRQPNPACPGYLSQLAEMPLTSRGT
jgi:hypothetical protein